MRRSCGQRHHLTKGIRVGAERIDVSIPRPSRFRSRVHLGNALLQQARRNIATFPVPRTGRFAFARFDGDEDPG